MIPRLRPSIGWAEIVAAFRAQHSVEEFEAEFAQLMGQAHGIAFPYGRSGLMLLLEALGLRQREVICPAYTCVVVAHAIVRSGNLPVFVDSREGDFNMDLDAAEAAISDRTGAIIATSIHGYPIDLDRLEALRRRHPNVAVIQDCAHSFGAEWQGRPVQRAGSAAVFGLNISKLITSIFGGMVTTDDDVLAARLKALRVSRMSNPGMQRNITRALYQLAATIALNPLAFAFVDRLRRAGFLSRFTDYYDPETIDMPPDHLVAMCQAEASVGQLQITRYPEIIARRRRLAELYDRLLEDCPGLVRPPIVPGATYSHYLARVKDPDRLVEALRRRGIELGRLIDYCVPDMAAYRAYVPEGLEFPVTRQLNREVVNLPMHVSDQDARRIAAAVISEMRQMLPMERGSSACLAPVNVQ